MALVLAGAIGLAAAPAWADMADVQRAVQRGDFKEAEKELTRMAVAGDIAGQFELALLYLRGTGVTRNFAEARRWSEAAAKRGHAGAQWTIGLLLESGEGGPRDLQAARRWYEQAAAQKFDLAKRALARMGVNDAMNRGDYQNGFLLARPLAEAGDPVMQTVLAQMYRLGQGTTIDRASSVKWVEAAAAQGHPPALVMLGTIYETGDGRPQSLEKARELYGRAADANFDLGRAALARLNAQGQRPASGAVAGATAPPQVLAPQAPTAARDRIVFVMPTGFKTGFQDIKPGRTMFEYVHESESVENWTEMVTVIITRVAPDLSPVSMIQDTYKLWRDRCPTAPSIAPAQRVEKGYPTALVDMSCDELNTAGLSSNVKTKKHERLAMKVLQGRDSMYVVQRAWHSDSDVVPRDKSSTGAEWARFFDEVEVCDASVPGQSCRSPRPVTQVTVTTTQPSRAVAPTPPSVAPNTPARPAAAVPARPAPPVAAPNISSGSGFAVNKAGFILTNNHVVATCKDISVRQASGQPVAAAIVSQDAQSDLAILKAAEPQFAVATFRRDGAIRAGDFALTYGFPLAGGLLGSQGSVTTGAITSVAGPGDDPRLLQTSVAVQPGNSGGPLLDTSGNVVGVVTASLNALTMMLRTGTLPQNVNFAVKDSVIREFLRSNGVAFETAPSGKRMEPADIGDAARRFTVMVECKN